MTLSLFLASRNSSTEFSNTAQEESYATAIKLYEELVAKPNKSEAVVEADFDQLVRFWSR